MPFFTEFFDRAGAQTDDLSRLFVFEEGSLARVSNSCVEIRVREDTWRVVAAKSGLLLLHNNYVVNDDYSRTFVGGFHVQGDRTGYTFLNKLNTSPGSRF